jgi:dienelactone hydrolase
MKAVCGNYHEMMVHLSQEQTFPMSFLSPHWTDAQVWQSETRAAIMDALGTVPRPVPLNASIDNKYERDGLTVEYISYDQPFGPRTEGILLYPVGAAEPLPGVLALHSHDAIKYFGKEKLVAIENEPEILTRFKKESYEGQSWATRLAQRGYAVFVPDLFMWGSRKLDPQTVPVEFVQALLKLPVGSEEYIKAYNDFTGNYESLIAKSVFMAGSSWAGIMVSEDRRALDYFISRPEVDSNRLACGGLSCGGLRSVYLAALDARIKCMFTAGFMSTYASVVKDRINWHTWMLHVPKLAALLDFPDILSLVGQTPCLALYNTEDPLWTMEGQTDAHTKLIRLFAKLGSPEKYSGRFYPGGHKLDKKMQDDAFDFLDTWLKAPMACNTN